MTDDIEWDEFDDEGDDGNGGWGESIPVADPVTQTIRLVGVKCSTCIFRPGNLMHLDAGRVRELTDQALMQRGHIVCHQTLPGMEKRGLWLPGAVCAGYRRLPAARLFSDAVREAAENPKWARYLDTETGELSRVEPEEG